MVLLIFCAYEYEDECDKKKPCNMEDIILRSIC